MKNIIVSGMMYGDEGKGTIIDYLISQNPNQVIVRSTGGCQGIHHVSHDGELYRFCHLSSGTINLNSVNKMPTTVITKEFIINLKTLVTEINEIAGKLKIPSRHIVESLYINRHCRVVTEYHKLIGIIRETIKENRRGSMSSGVSTTASLSNDLSLTIYLEDIYDSHINDNFKNKLNSLRLYLTKFIKENRDKIKIADNSVDDDRYNHIINTLDIYTSNEFFDSEYNKIIESYEYLLSTGLYVLHDDTDIFLFTGKNRLFESSQGLLLDKNYGTIPNTTLLNINNDYAFKLCKGQDTKVIGVIRALVTRHGPGLFPTYDKYLNEILKDENQDTRKFVGAPKYGWFDVVLAKYSADVLKVDEIALTCIDELFELDEIKICTGYQYSGDRLRSDLEKYFEYEDFYDYFVITKVKVPHKEVFQILKECSPVYLSLGKITSNNYIDYIKWIERYMGIKVTIASMGPDRKDKLMLEE